jgi:hypothetical protein
VDESSGRKFLTQGTKQRALWNKRALYEVSLAQRVIRVVAKLTLVSLVCNKLSDGGLENADVPASRLARLIRYITL